MKDFLADIEPEILLIPGCDSALIGYVWRCGERPHAVYCHQRLVACLMDQGMSRAQAMEHISHTIEGTWQGAHTPAVLRPCQ